MNNIYYNPEKFGLSILGEADNGGGYEFTKFVIWQDAAGQLYYCTDQGCSCPIPFDDVGLDDLTKATPAEVHQALDEWASELGTNWVTEDVADLHRAVMTT